MLALSAIDILNSHSVPVSDKYSALSAVSPSITLLLHSRIFSVASIVFSLSFTDCTPVIELPISFCMFMSMVFSWVAKHNFNKTINPSHTAS